MRFTTIHFDRKWTANTTAPHDLSSLSYGYSLGWNAGQARGLSRGKLGMIEGRESWSVGITSAEMDLWKERFKILTLSELLNAQIFW